MTQLSEHFTLREMTRSDTAVRKRIDNTPSEQVVLNLKRLCANVLEPIRGKFGPVMVTSGYRSPKLNVAIGGSKTSQHCVGEAADIECAAVDNVALATWIRDHLWFDQLILEFATPGDPRSGWVHVSFRGSQNRGEVLTAQKRGRKTVYLKGIVP